MYKILIVDDNKKNLDQHKERIQSQFNGNKIDTHIYDTHNPKNISYDISYDVAFLDIDMPHINGFSIAQQLTVLHTKIIFITNRDDLVYQSLQYQPFGYIRKSHFEEDFLMTFERLIPKLKNYIIINYNHSSIKLSIHDIKYAESFGHNLVVHTKKHEYEIRYKLSYLFELIHSIDFMIINQSYLVNFEYVQDIIDFDCILTTGECLPISRRKLKDVKQQYYQYIFRSV